MSAEGESAGKVAWWNREQPAYVLEAFLRLSAHQNKRVLVGVLAAGTVLAIVAARGIGLAPAAAWLAVLIASQLYRLRMEAKLARPQAMTLADRVRRRVEVAAWCGGAQALVLAAFPMLQISEQAFVTAIQLGLVTGAVANSGGHPRTVFAYAGPILVPLALLWALTDVSGAPGWMGPAMGVLIVFHASVLYGFAQNAWSTFEESCGIRFEQAALNARLADALSVAEAANIAKTRFLAAASHDLRQPLHTITALSAALSLRRLDERSLEIVTLLTEVTDTLSGQLDDLLDISKLDAGVVQVHYETVVAADLVTRHFAEVRELIQSKGLRAELVVRSTAHVSTDPLLFARILRNLSFNAVKFTERGSVTISAHDEQEHVVIVVQDTGCGIAPEHHRNVFQEFFQVGNLERDRDKGLGLGLSIVQRLSELLGFPVEMRSAVGEGTSFIFRVPHALRATRKAAPDAPAQTASFGLHVLVIDDEMVVRSATSMLLEELGCTYTQATGSAVAGALAAAQRPDLVLADFRLAGGDSGLLALEAVRHECGAVPAVLVSGDTAPQRLREAMEAGYRLLHKPLSLAQLRIELAAAEIARQERIKEEANGEPIPYRHAGAPDRR